MKTCLISPLKIPWTYQIDSALHTHTAYYDVHKVKQAMKAISRSTGVIVRVIAGFVGRRPARAAVGGGGVLGDGAMD